MNMEVGFLSSSSSSIKPLNNFPASALKPRIPNSPDEQHFGSYECRTGRRSTPFSLKCCSDGSSTSSLEDNTNHSIAKADWRSFRSKLMASQHATKPIGSSRLSDFVTKADHYTHVDKEKPWAHILHKPETGCLLVPTDKLDRDHIFTRSVILVLSNGHPTGSSLGVIVNRPINETKSTVRNDLDAVLDAPLSYGGPSCEEVFLVGPEEEDYAGDEWLDAAGFKEVVKGFYFGTNKAKLVQKSADGVGIKVLKVFDGCCRWEQRKLEEEVRDGYWKVIACSPSIFGLA